MEQLKLNKRPKPVQRVDISINMEKTGANIRRLIKASGYSVKDIMAITGISTEQAVYKWYRGESIPAIETMLILTNALGIGINELLVIDGEFHFFVHDPTDFFVSTISKAIVKKRGLWYALCSIFIER